MEIRPNDEDLMGLEDQIKEVDCESFYRKKDIHAGEKPKGLPDEERGIYMSPLSRSQRVTKI